MTWSRRGFLKSLSRTALVLSLEDVLRLARPALGQSAAQAPTQQKPVAGMERPSFDAKPKAVELTSPIAGTPLGLSFVDVAKSAGLTTKTIYGGEHKNKYLLETTGCGGYLYRQRLAAGRLSQGPGAGLPLIQEQS